MCKTDLARYKLVSAGLWLMSPLCIEDAAVTQCLAYSQVSCYCDSGVSWRLSVCSWCMSHSRKNRTIPSLSPLIKAHMFVLQSGHG